VQPVFAPVQLVPDAEQTSMRIIPGDRAGESTPFSFSFAGLTWPPKDTETTKKFINLAILVAAGLYAADLLVRVSDQQPN